MRHPAPQWSRDMSAMHTPSREEDRADGLGTVDVEEQGNGGIGPSWGRHFMTPVFWISLAVVGVVVGLALVLPQPFYDASGTIRNVISERFGWYYLLLVAMVVLACLFFMIGPTGAIRLGDPTEMPRFSTMSWLAMLFSAGMGIGLVFWGAAEPLSPFASSSPEAEVGSSEALRDAFRYSFFHWGISAWVIYGLVAAALAYFRFRKKEKTLISVTLKPLFGDRMNGIAGNIVDAITIFATVVGVGTSLGMGAVQINGGLSHLFGMPSNLAIQLVIIAVATALFLASALSGLSRGVKLLSNLNVVLAIVLVAVCIVIGSTTKVFDALVTAIGDYTQNFPSMSLSVSPYDTTHQSWIRGWTIFYWSWWIAWSPFVSVFIARISRGRSIRQFLLGVILIPTVFSCIWFATFGTLSTSAQINGADLASLPTESVLFGTLAQYPLERPLSILSVLLIISFFVTSADSATFVLGMISEDGNLDPHKRTKVIWGLLLSVLGAVLLMVGGLDALQNVLIITALPFSVIILLMVLARFRELNHERLMMGLYIRPTAFPEQDKPFRSYEDDPPIEPVELMQRDIELMQRLRPDEDEAVGDDEEIEPDTAPDAERT